MEQNKNNLKENKMGTMPEFQLLVNISLPMMIAMFVTALYNIVDSIFVSRISENALTAVSLAFPMQTLMIALAAGTGVGVNALCSRALGQKDRKKANEVAANGIFVYALSYLVMLIIGLTLVKPFYAMQTSAEQAEIMELGIQYLSIILICSFGTFSQFIFERLLQATGRTVHTMISQGTGAIVNIILDPIMIFGLLGCPKMGIAGAALATVIGQIIAATMAFIFNKKFNTDIDMNLKGFKPNGKMIREIYKIGVPSICMQAIGSVMTYGMNLILMGLTSTATAVFGVYYKLQSFFIMPVIGLNNGMIPIISYNYGAGRKDRITKTIRYAFFIGAFFTLIGFLGFELIPDKLLMIFDASEDMLAIGTKALRTIGIHFVVAWFCIIAGSMFQALGKAVFSLYVSVARQLVVLLPVAYILAKVGGLDAIWWSFPIAEVMSVAISLVCFIKTKREILDKMPG